ncbi:hypothetical protein HCH_01998 [Hahella chejuensis KCTC 2396]|uniref:Uncharacterized protein n=1 Tax=Hahella chejuensis (strain KCTC 2396) TaxID=349521 RepID=Q2SKJ2_HAHCH|nr:hypothetical protein [Hahella chejuensis]ABC28832.1 hypothetical protein HCH_01998 [Hahella chejuensis KCTC 2396]
MKKVILLAAAMGCGMQSVGAEETKMRAAGSKVIYIETTQTDEFDRREYEQDSRGRGYDYESHHRANRKLRKRVKQLELAVRQLQDTVFELQNAAPPAPAPKYSCLLSTHKGTFIGSGMSKLEAKGIVVQQCEANNPPYLCGIHNVTCEKNK